MLHGPLVDRNKTWLWPLGSGSGGNIGFLGPILVADDDMRELPKISGIRVARLLLRRLRHIHITPPFLINSDRKSSLMLIYLNPRIYVHE